MFYNYVHSLVLRFPYLPLSYLYNPLVIHSLQFHDDRGVGGQVEGVGTLGTCCGGE